MITQTIRGSSNGSRQANAPPVRGSRRGVTVRTSSWWLDKLRQRAASMYDEQLDLTEPPSFASQRERDAAIRFFNAAYRAEESGLMQAHQLAEDMSQLDPELAEALRLYGDEEGWHRELLVEFLDYLGGDIRPMGTITGSFYKLYGRAQRMETIMLTNLMFETIGSTTYRLALRYATQPAVRQMLTILTRDEAFHVPLNVHFIREVLKRKPGISRLRMRILYKVLFVALVASTIASRRRAQPFDRIPLKVLARAYTEQLAGLFMNEPDLDLAPPKLLLRLFGLDHDALEHVRDKVAVSVAAAEQAADRSQVVVSAL